jgi:6-pyruvoyltetrahydropterin/6-carboxytetrahydropterin synthase
MSYEISTTRRFSAAHQIKLYDGSREPAHGHNWRVRVTVAAPRLDSIGVVMDFHELERRVDEIVQPWHNRHLNEMPDFAKLNPTAENVGVVVAERLRLPAKVRLLSVEVWETDENRAVIRPEPMLADPSVTRRT